MKKSMVVFVLCVVFIFLSMPYKHVNASMNSDNIKLIEEKKPIKYNDSRLCILMYHSIGYEKGNDLRMPPQMFRQQMKYIKDNGYVTLTLDDVYDFFAKNIPVPQKSVVITFDDGYEDNYVSAYPILKEYNLKASVFIIANAVDKDRSYMTSSQMKEMEKNSIDFQSHTFNHDQLNLLSYEDQLNTLKSSKELLEKILNKKISYVAFPVGKYNDNTIKAVKEAGYIMSFTTKGDFAIKSNGIYALHRVRVSSFDNSEVFKGRLITGSK